MRLIYVAVFVVFAALALAMWALDRRKPRKSKPGLHESFDLQTRDENPDA